MTYSILFISSVDNCTRFIILHIGVVKNRIIDNKRV